MVRTPFAFDYYMDLNNTGSNGSDHEKWFEERIVSIIVEYTHTPRERIAADTRLFDLTDSLGFMEIVMALEEEFEGSIPDERASTILTVGQLIEFVRTHLASQSASP
jgi:acyl carrier protein